MVPIRFKVARKIGKMVKGQYVYPFLPGFVYDGIMMHDHTVMGDSPLRIKPFKLKQTEVTLEHFNENWDETGRKDRRLLM